MSNKINYLVTYNSDINTLPTPTYLAPLKDIKFQRNIAPSEDNATITLAGIQKIDAAREVYIYRVNSDTTTTLKFRGMTTNPTYHVADDGLVTTVQIASLWYMLQTRLFQIAGKSPPPLQPNTNPYLVYLNPTLGLAFGQLWADIVTFAFQESYSTGHLPPLHLANLADDGAGNMNIGVIPPYVTDFDTIVVNDNMNVQYQSISAVVDRLVTSALFNSNQGKPFLAEYRMDIGDYPTPTSTIPHPEFVTPKLPTVTVMLFDPVHSKLGNGNNRTGIHLGDNSYDPIGTLPSALVYPMSYVEFGVTNGYEPIDTIIFSEGDSIVSIDLTYDYLVMNNSYVLSGGSFQGSDVVALPIDNQRSIAEYGLKQTNQSLSNVVDQGEISRFVGTSINFFQHPIPNIVIKPDYVYASTHTMYPGDYVLVNAPSLANVMEDSNGNLLEGSYDSITTGLITAAFTARIKTIDITWNPDDGEDITLTLSFPVQNVPIADWDAANYNQIHGSPAGAMQFMYTVVEPAAKTLLGRGRQAEGAATHQSGGDFITNRNNPFNVKVADEPPDLMSGVWVADEESLDIPIFAQTTPNTMDAISLSGASVKGDDILIYQFGVEVDTQTTSTGNTSVTPNDVYLTVIQPDGMAIYDGIQPLNQLANILSLISKSHTSLPPPPPRTDTSAPFFYDDVGNPNLSGKYEIILRNSRALPWCPTPLFSSLPAPTVSGGVIAGPANSPCYIYCPVDSNNNEFGMSYETFSVNFGTNISPVLVTWPAVIDPTTGLPVIRYNIYRGFYDTTNLIQDPLLFEYITNVPTPSFSDDFLTAPTSNTQPFVQSLTAAGQPKGLNVAYTGNAVPVGSSFVGGDQYWYVIAALNPEGIETEYSQANTTFNLPLDNTNNNSVPEPALNAVSESAWVPPPAVQTIEISWPAVPYAQSYNIYRANSPANPYPSSNLKLLTTVTAPTTVFEDDGTIAVGTQTPQALTQTASTNAVYTVYVNYSFLCDPAHTKIYTSGGTSNPNNAIVYDPTQRRVYGTHGYVAP